MIIFFFNFLFFCFVLSDKRVVRPVRGREKNNIVHTIQQGERRSHWLCWWGAICRSLANSVMPAFRYGPSKKPKTSDRNSLGLGTFFSYIAWGRHKENRACFYRFTINSSNTLRRFFGLESEVPSTRRQRRPTDGVAVAGVRDSPCYRSASHHLHRRSLINRMHIYPYRYRRLPTALWPHWTSARTIFAFSFYRLFGCSCFLPSRIFFLFFSQHRSCTSVIIPLQRPLAAINPPFRVDCGDCSLSHAETGSLVRPRTRRLPPPSPRTDFRNGKSRQCRRILHVRSSRLLVGTAFPRVRGLRGGLRRLSSIRSVAFFFFFKTTKISLLIFNRISPVGRPLRTVVRRRPECCVCWRP